MSFLHSIGDVAKSGIVKSGSLIKKGAVHLYENKDEYIGKVQNKIEKKQVEIEKNRERITREATVYEKRYQGYTTEQLKEIVRDESKSTAQRLAAKNLLQ